MKFQHKIVAVMLLGIAGMAMGADRKAKPGWTKQNAGVQTKQGKELTPREISKMTVTPETEGTLYNFAVFSWLQGPRDAARQVLEKDNPTLKGQWNKLTSDARNARARGENLSDVIPYKYGGSAVVIEQQEDGGIKSSEPSSYDEYMRQRLAAGEDEF